MDTDLTDRLPNFTRRVRWFMENNPEFREHVAVTDKPDGGRRFLTSIVTTAQLPSVLRFMLDEDEFLSPHGVRALSRYHKDHPYVLRVDGHDHRVDYEPAESTTSLFGGNSNWRGPVWFPVNYLLVESLQKFHHFFGDSLKVACPTGSDRLLNLSEVAAELSRRLVGSSCPAPTGAALSTAERRSSSATRTGATSSSFHEYFHGDNGAGIGASHQTGWTGAGGQAAAAERRVNTAHERAGHDRCSSAGFAGATWFLGGGFGGGQRPPPSERRRHRRQPPDGLDGPGSQAAAAERRVKRGRPWRPSSM